MSNNPVDTTLAQPAPLWRRAFNSQRREFLKHVLTLVSGTAAAQVILVAAYPVLTRLYEPADFATLQVYLIWTTIIAAIGSGRYELAIMFSETERDRRSVAWLSLIACCVTSLISGIALIAFSYGSQYAEYVVGPPSVAVWLIPLGGLCYGWGVVVQRWEAWFKRFRGLALAQVAGNAVTVAAQFLLGWMAERPTGTHLVVANLLGLLVTSCLMSVDLVRELWRERGEFCWKEIRRIAGVHWKFPVFSTSAQLIGRVAVEIPKLMIGGLFTSSSLGLFSLSMRVSQFPLTLIGQAFGQVFFRQIAEHRTDSRSAQKLLGRSALLLLGIIAVPMLVLCIWAEPLFGFVFGPEWTEAGTYARLLIPMMVMGFVVTPISYSVQAFEKQQMVFIWNSSALPLSLASIYIGYLLNDVTWAILLYSLSLMMIHLTYFWMCMQIAGNLGKSQPAEQEHAGGADAT